MSNPGAQGREAADASEHDVERGPTASPHAPLEGPAQDPKPKPEPKPNTRWFDLDENSRDGLTMGGILVSIVGGIIQIGFFCARPDKEAGLAKSTIGLSVIAVALGIISAILTYGKHKQPSIAILCAFLSAITFLASTITGLLLDK